MRNIGDRIKEVRPPRAETATHGGFQPKPPKNLPLPRGTTTPEPVGSTGAPTIDRQLRHKV